MVFIIYTSRHTHYSRPGAVLLQRVQIQQDGEVKVAIATSALSHDVTGGVRAKLQTAGNIVRTSCGKTRVFVTNVLGDNAFSACVQGVLNGRGTEIVAEGNEADISP